MPAKTGDTKSESSETPHYHGHRMRLRERFYGAGPDALSDYELLELALFPALPRRDTKPLAKSLLRKFGSFAEVIHAPEARLREVKRNQLIADEVQQTGTVDPTPVYPREVIKRALELSATAILLVHDNAKFARS